MAQAAVTKCLPQKVKKSLENLLFFRGKKKLPKKHIFLNISSTYAKFLGETNFCTREIPRSGSKAEDGGEEREKEREKD